MGEKMAFAFVGSPETFEPSPSCFISKTKMGVEEVSGFRSGAGVDGPYSHFCR